MSKNNKLIKEVNKVKKNKKIKLSKIFEKYGYGKTGQILHRILKNILYYGPLFKKQCIGEYNFGLYENKDSYISAILIKRLEKLLIEYNIKYIFNKTENIFIFKDLNSKIILKSIEDPDNIIGYETADCILVDLNKTKLEYSEIVIERILARNRKSKPYLKSNKLYISDYTDIKKYKKVEKIKFEYVNLM